MLYHIRGPTQGGEFDFPYPEAEEEREDAVSHPTQMQVHPALPSGSHEESLSPDHIEIISMRNNSKSIIYTKNIQNINLGTGVHIWLIKSSQMISGLREKMPLGTCGYRRRNLLDLFLYKNSPNID